MVPEISTGTSTGKKSGTVTLYSTLHKACKLYESGADFKEEKLPKRVS